MATADVNTAYLATGRLAHSCTAIGTHPHGGTEVGLVGAVFLFPQSLSKSLLAEETNAAVEVLWLGGDVTVSFTLLNADKDGLNFINPNASTVSSASVTAMPGSTVTVGAPTTTYSNVIFTPRNSDHPGFILYNAAPVPEVNSRLAFSAYRWHEVPAVLIGLPHASTGAVGKYGKFSALTL